MTEPAGAPLPPAGPRKQTTRLSGYAVLAVAVLVAIGAALYLLVPGGDSSGTRSSASPGASARLTPAGNTGVLDSRRPKEGEPAPDFALVDARDPSVTRKLSDFRGKGVVLNWYASWCGPCRQEIPDFQRAQEALGDQVVFLGVDYLEPAAEAVSILDVMHAKYPAVLDSDGAVADHYRVGQGGGGLPTSFFVDRDGILRGTVTGRVTNVKLQENLAKLGITYAAPE